VLFFCSCYIHCISNLLPLIYYLYMLQYLQYIVVATSCTIPPSNLLTSFLSFAQLLLLAFFQIFGGYILHTCSRRLTLSRSRRIPTIVWI